MTTTKKVVKEVGATAMDVEVVTKLLQDAKELYDMGKFSPLYQQVFFDALAEQIPPPAPPPSPAPPPVQMADAPDGISASASTGAAK